MSEISAIDIFLERSLVRVKSQGRRDHIVRRRNPVRATSARKRHQRRKRRFHAGTSSGVKLINIGLSRALRRFVTTGRIVPPFAMDGSVRPPARIIIESLFTAK